MESLELFAGTGSFSKVMAQHGYKTFTIDIEPSMHPDSVSDILYMDDLTKQYDFIWASPPCQAFSVASIGKSWTGGHRAYIPKSDSAKLGLRLLDKTIYLIAKSKPKYWCIENPRGVMRKVIEPIFDKYGITDYHRLSVSYCQYGDKRMKPTDIWTNIKGWEGKMCKNNSTDHEAAPRGAKTGTQGLKGAKDRSVIPPAVFEEMLTKL